TTSEVQALFDRHGVPSSPYRTVREAMADPQLAHRQAFTEVRDTGGTFRALNPPFRMSGAQAAAVPHVASLGEHTEELLTEIGYGRDEISKLFTSAKSEPRA
ncbi:MAG: CoA transferase, partial [Alphaproteobacteria bacterium]|nr:CoA transferase [Alphaproteobacteria bacterium]